MIASILDAGSMETDEPVSSSRLIASASTAPLA